MRLISNLPVRAGQVGLRRLSLTARYELQPCPWPLQVVLSSGRPTRQAGGALSGPGGSANAVSGYYSPAAVAAALASGAVPPGALQYGSATPTLPDPWWAVDLGSSVPLLHVEVTAHVNHTLENLEVRLTDHAVLYGDEGYAVLSGLYVAAGDTQRFALGGLQARHLILRIPTTPTNATSTSLRLGQVDVAVERSSYVPTANELLTAKPLSYPRVFDMARTRGPFTLLTPTAAAGGGYAGAYDDLVTVAAGELATLAFDGVAEAGDVGQCARAGPQAGVSPWLQVDLVGGAWGGGAGPSPAVSRLELLKAADPVVGEQLDHLDVLLGDSPVGGVCRVGLRLGEGAMAGLGDSWAGTFAEAKGSVRHGKLGPWQRRHWCARAPLSAGG